MSAPPPPLGSTPAGWYPDPWGLAWWRWWNGADWTGYTEPPASAAAPGAGPLLEPVREPLRQPLRAGGIAALGMLVGIVLATAIAVVLALLGATESDPVLLVASSAGLWVGLVGACVVAVRRKGTGSLRDLGLVRVRWADPLLGLGFGVAGLVSVGVVLSILNQISPDLLPGNRDDISDPLRHGGTLGVVAVALVAVVGAPFVEELFFRGLVQGTLVSRWGLAIGVTAQAVLFGLVHLSPAAGLGNVGTFVNILVVGMGLGWIRFVSRRLDPGMFAHATYNALFVLIAITR